LNQVLGSQKKHLLLEVAVPAGSNGQVLELAKASSNYRNPANNQDEEKQAVTSLRFTADAAVAKASVSKDVKEKVAPQLATEANEEAVKLRDEGKSEEIDKVLGLELGADAIIEKPFGVQEILARIRAILRRSTQLLASQPISLHNIAAFQIGYWHIHPTALRATQGNQVVDLSLREVRLLDLLVKHTNQVVDRDEFFRKCWDLDQAPLSRTLDQHIAHLRKKLESDPAELRLIRTVQGLGYRYDPNSSA
jgi:DNA-binding winged helix-turn-helix (wHTH) protein